MKGYRGEKGERKKLMKRRRNGKQWIKGLKENREGERIREGNTKNERKRAKKKEKQWKKGGLKRSDVNRERDKWMNRLDEKMKRERGKGKLW